MNSIKSNSKAKPSSRMEENRKRIEEQLKKSSTNSSRPTPNAVAVGFQSTASRLANQVSLVSLILFLIRIVNEISSSDMLKINLC